MMTSLRKIFEEQENLIGEYVFPVTVCIPTSKGSISNKTLPYKVKVALKQENMNYVVSIDLYSFASFVENIHTIKFKDLHKAKMEFLRSYNDSELKMIKEVILQYRNAIISPRAGNKSGQFKLKFVLMIAGRQFTLPYSVITTITGDTKDGGKRGSVFNLKTDLFYNNKLESNLNRAYWFSPDPNDITKFTMASKDAYFTYYNDMYTNIHKQITKKPQ